MEDPQYVISKVTELIQTRIKLEPRFALAISKENGMLCVDLWVFDGSAYTCYYTADGVNDSSIQSPVDM